MAGSSGGPKSGAAVSSFAAKVRLAPLGQRARAKRKGIAEWFLRRGSNRQARLQPAGLRVHLVSERDLAGGVDRLPRRGLRHVV